MQTFKDFPAPLKEKYISLIAMGVIICLAGICASLLFKDTTILILSLLIFVFSLIKAGLFYETVSKKEYEAVKGTCLMSSHILIRKQKKVKILDVEGNERSLILSRHSKVSIGKEYIFYFKATKRFSLGSEYFDSVLSSDCFLGYEEVKNDNQQ